VKGRGWKAYLTRLLITAAAASRQDSHGNAAGLRQIDAVWERRLAEEATNP